MQRTLAHLPATSAEDDDVFSSSIETGRSLDRRNFLQSIAAAACFVLTVRRPQQAMAIAINNDSDSDEEFQCEVTATLPKGFSREAFDPKSSLVITVNPAVTTSDQIPQHIAEGSLSTTGHWVPIVMQYKQPCNNILCRETTTTTTGGNDFVLTLTKQHVTALGHDWNGWKQLPLVVTAKIDADGQISTVEPMDLVGCRILMPNTIIHNNGPRGGIAKQQVTLPLQTRGLCPDTLSTSA